MEKNEILYKDLIEKLNQKDCIFEDVIFTKKSASFFSQAHSSLEIRLDKKKIKSLTFVNCIFEITVLFIEINIDDFEFRDCVFEKNFHMSRSKIEDLFYFHNCIFNNEVNILNCHFLFTDIIGNKFNNIFMLGSKDEHKDRRSTFSGYTNISSVFNGFTSISNCDFLEVDFENSSFDNYIFEFNNCNVEKIARFRKLNLTEKVIFNNINIDNLSFLFSYFKFVSFTNCSVNVNNLIDKRLLEPNNPIYIFLKEEWDNDYVISKYKNFNIQNLFDEYKQFEVCFDNQKNYEIAGEFHKQRFELERTNSKKYWLKYSLLTLYKWSSDYGENYKKSLSWFLHAFVFFTVVYLFSGLNFTDHNGTVTIFYLKAVNQFNFWNDLGLSTIYSLNNVIPFKKDLTYITAANGWTTFFTILESFILTILASLFVIGLRRKFKR
ncbi:MAG: hypothetical protein J0M18_08635 [Ignavibacteria bacterium]|nr:hypothetical protein [Ignavibacteria bacterium]